MLRRLNWRFYMRLRPRSCAVELVFLWTIGVVGSAGVRAQEVFEEETLLDETLLHMLSPKNWPEGDRKEFELHNRKWRLPKPLATGKKMMVAGTSGAFAVRAGLEALKKGGSAADAVLTTALLQIALDAGCWNSYAGILSLIYYDAISRQVFVLDAGYQVPLAEEDPMTIPKSPVPSGRTALVPGFIAGVVQAHERFGSLPFAALFGPAIEVAEDGFPMGPVLAGLIKSKTDLLRRGLPSRAIFFDSSGDAPAPGDLFRQPDLAATLRAVAKNRTEHFYSGPWAESFVRAVRAEGGLLTLDDMKRYRVVFAAPIRTTYRGADVFAGAGSRGATNIVEALNLLEEAGLEVRVDADPSPEDLYSMIQIARMGPLISYSPKGYLGYHFPGISFSPQSRVTKENARSVWAKMQEPGWMEEFQGRPTESTEKKDAGTPEKSGGHSDGVVAVDEKGNIAVLTHTINTTAWGSTGLFVGGVSIPDSASFQQKKIADAGPRGRLSNEMNPLLILRDGKHLLACSSIGSGLHEVTLQCVHRVIDLGMDPKQAVEAPYFLGMVHRAGEDGRVDFYSQAIPERGFRKEVLDKVREMGQPLHFCVGSEERAYRGYWIGIAADPRTGEYRGGVSPELNGYALGE